MSDAQAAHDAAAANAVFGNLPDTLLAPSEGPTPTVTPDFRPGYYANDFSLLDTPIPVDAFGSLYDWEQTPGDAPVFMVPGFGQGLQAVNGQGFGFYIPYGLLGSGPGDGPWVPNYEGVTQVINPGANER